MIRKATIYDLDEIINLNRLLFELEYNNFDNTLDINWPTSREGRGYFMDVINKDITLVCEMDNRVVGYLTGTLNTEYSYNTLKQAELNNMCVLQEYRNKGIGSELYDEFRRICIDNNINEIKVVASFNNKNAINFYKTVGFKEAEITLKHEI